MHKSSSKREVYSNMKGGGKERPQINNIFTPHRVRKKKKERERENKVQTQQKEENNKNQSRNK